MLEYYRIRHAQSADEVLTELRKFVDSVKSGPAITLLPSTLYEISSRDAADVGKWQEQIEHVARTMSPISATVLFWLNLLDEMFEGARQRLDELLRASDAGRRFVPIPAVGARFALLDGRARRCEIATAVAGSILRIHPFDQPDGEAKKTATRQLTGPVQENLRTAATAALPS